MREILFRGKRTDTKEWIEGVAFQHDNDKVTMFSQHPVDGTLVGKEIDPETVGQYTGLTDKKGTKIFEGDIVIYNDNENADSEGEFSIVVWYDDDVIGFALEHHSPSCEVYYECEWVQSCCYYEIIGNVFDNPELLKDGKSE